MAASNLVPCYAWGVFERGGEWEITGAIEFAVTATGSDRDV